MATFPHFPRSCHICGGELSAEKCGTDEHGSPVHERCYARKLLRDRKPLRRLKENIRRTRELIEQTDELLRRSGFPSETLPGTTIPAINEPRNR